MIRSLLLTPDSSSDSLHSTVPALLAVDRAISDLRRGSLLSLRDRLGGRHILLAAEAATLAGVQRLKALTGQTPRLLITGRRALVLGLISAPAEGQDLPAVVEIRGVEDPANLAALIDPTQGKISDGPFDLALVAPGGAAEAAVVLAKLARLLPAALIIEATSLEADPALLEVEAQAVLDYQPEAARSLRRVSEARVPLEDAEQTRVVAFRPADGGIEHLAIVIGEPDAEQPVLTRLHSECFTGDLLGSLRCDCGDQLRGAIAEIAAAGSGVLLYLAQEGRGIGLINKLRAYQLQDQGFDTLDANGQLGFDDDERVYLPAAAMLQELGIEKVRLLTNNPNKVAALARHGVAVVERVPHVFPSNDHNVGYLRTKATRSGHLF